MDSPKEDSLFPNAKASLGWVLLFLLFVLGIFSYPYYPLVDLDPSWRMAYGYFFQQKLQFGRDIVFNYGPLGFIMGKTYSGLQFASLIFSQLALAVLGAWVILREGRRMRGLTRWAFFLGLLCFGVTYEDALQILVIALIGFQLLRREDKTFLTTFFTLVLAVLSVIKFTNFMLASVVTVTVVGLDLWRGRRREGWLIAATFLGGFIATWIACGQNPLNLPAYLRGSWEISDGYNATMGITTPWPPLWKALIVLGVIGGYLLLHLKLNPDKPRAVANALVLAAFIFLNWKHGFVRADGHMIGFFFCALLPLTAYPSLLDDPPRCRRLHYAVFLMAGIISLWGIEVSLYHAMRSCFGIIETKIWSNLERTIDPTGTKRIYDARLLAVRESINLPLTRAVVGKASIDVLGFEQATALFNDFNYKPRPIFQSYSVFTPYLAHLNGRYFEGDTAPDYVLLKLQTLDERMPMMDDSEVLRLLPYRYDFVHSERGYQLWRRLEGKFDPATITPKPLLTTDLALGDTLPLDAYAGKKIWARIELKHSLLGWLQSFLYKPTPVRLTIKDANGIESTYRLPLPIARNGFVISPVIEDLHSYNLFANSRSNREARSLLIGVEPANRYLFSGPVHIELGELPPSHAASRFFSQQLNENFPMFRTFPVQFEAHAKLSRGIIDGKEIVVLHAPSEMIFNLPPKAQVLSGSFGFLPGAYRDGGGTNGAEFIVQWSNGVEQAVLFRRSLDPANVPTDRGLQNFSIPLKDLSGGQLSLRIDPGQDNNVAWDWTCWTGIEIK